MVHLNNGRYIFKLDEAYNKIIALPKDVLSYDDFCYILKNEICYLLKHSNKITVNNVLFTQDMILYALIDKMPRSPIKTQEVKKIISFLKFGRKDEDYFTWFMKNLNKGYIPTQPVLDDIIHLLSPENQIKLLEMYPTKVNAKLIATTSYLVNNIFNDSDVEKNNEKFRKLKLSRDIANEIIMGNAFDINQLEKIENSAKTKNIKINYNSYIINILNYKISQKLTISPFELDKLAQLNFYPLVFLLKLKEPTEIQKNVLDNLKQLIENLSKTHLLMIISTILNKNYVKDNLLFIKNYCNFEKFNENNINTLIKDKFFNNFPIELLFEFYQGDFNKKFINLLLLYGSNTFIKYIINIIEFDPEKYKLFNINCSLDDIFEMSFESCNSMFVEYFLNNKFKLTEEMVLNNNSKELINILKVCIKHGFYISEKCFNHIVLNIVLSDNNYTDIKKLIQSISIYLNDDEEFLKYAIQIEEKRIEYINLIQILIDMKNTIDYLSDKKVSVEMISLCDSKHIRAYLLNRMEKERNIKKIIVKKVVKKTLKSKLNINE